MVDVRKKFADLTMLAELATKSYDKLNSGTKVECSRCRSLLMDASKLTKQLRKEVMITRHALDTTPPPKPKLIRQRRADDAGVPEVIPNSVGEPVTEPVPSKPKRVRKPKVTKDI